MGGNAFNKKNIPPQAFPRIPPPIYEALKARLTPILQSVFHFVSTPSEVPGKLDHGDLDFTVTNPQSTSAVTLELLSDLKSLLGATEHNPVLGNRTSNFAVPIPLGEWSTFGQEYAQIEMERRRESAELYYQVDVHVCDDKAEMDRVLFFNSYGDLGMILGLIATNVGLKLGLHGLKCPNQPFEPIMLSEDFDEIMSFFGMCAQTRRAGFSSKTAIFEWAASSRFFDPTFFRTIGPGISKVKSDRTMYAQFTAWADAQIGASVNRKSPDDIITIRNRTRREALAHFGKELEYDELHRLDTLRKEVKQVFTGTNVQEWTGIAYWKDIQLVMDKIREPPEWRELILQALKRDGEAGVKSLVLDARDQLEHTLERKFTTLASRQGVTTGS